jgi:hypothetical protein
MPWQERDKNKKAQPCHQKKEWANFDALVADSNAKCDHYIGRVTIAKAVENAWKNDLRFNHVRLAELLFFVHDASKPHGPGNGNLIFRCKECDTSADLEISMEVITAQITTDSCKCNFCQATDSAK